MSDDGQARDEIEEIAKEDELVQEAIIETIIDKEITPVKAKPKAKAKTTPKIK